MTGELKILRIEVDGHFHGSSDVPKPWVAQIDGVDAKYGLARTFVQQLRDYRGARRAWSGNLHGVVAAFPLHEGKLYEVSRLRGKTSKRHVAREFWRVEAGKLVELGPMEALAAADPQPGAVLEHAVPDGTRITRVDGLGTPAVCGFVLGGRDRGGQADRLYRLRVGAIHEVETGDARHLVIVGDRGVERVSQAEAITRLWHALHEDPEASFLRQVS